jgi:hypothetical protein
VAATAALVAGEGGQTAQAADGTTLVIGVPNQGTSETFLGATVTPPSSASPLFAVDASISTNTSAIAIRGTSHVTNGTGVYGTSNTGYGMYGYSNSGNAVFGFSSSGTAIWGASNTNPGMYGQSGSGVGVRADSNSSDGVSSTSNSGNGVYGQSGTGIGVYGFSGTFVGVHGIGSSSTAGVGGWFQGGRAALALGQGGAPGAPTANMHFQGDIYLDSLATAWVCVADGTPGTWVRLPSVPNGTVGGSIQYLSTPVRLLDARTSSSSGLVNRGALAGNEVYTFGVAGLGGSGIPASAQGLIGNVTVLGPSGAGNLSLFPAGGAVPTVASMTFGTAGLFLANGVNVAIGSGGAINIQNQSGGTTPLVLDAVAFVS